MWRAYQKVVIHHVFLGITAMMMMKQTLLISDVTIFNPLKYFIVFISTIVVYQLAVSGVSIPFKSSLIHRSKLWILMMIVLLIILVILIVKSLLLKEQLLLLIILLSCFGYFTPVGKWKGLRAIPALKGVLLASAWSLVTVAFPLISIWNWNTHFIFLIQRFLFMLGICIVYNLRDVDADRKHGIATIASLAGEKNTRIISGSCELLFALSVLLYHGNIYLKMALLIPAIVTVIVISRAKINGSVFYYRYIIDGCMMLQSLSVIFFAGNYYIL